MALTNFRPEDFLPRSTLSQRLRFGRHIKTFNQTRTTLDSLSIEKGQIPSVHY